METIHCANPAGELVTNAAGFFVRVHAPKLQLAIAAGPGETRAVTSGAKAR